MLSALQNGDVVVTSGGIMGAIVAIDADDTVVLQVKPDNVKIQVSAQRGIEPGLARVRSSNLIITSSLKA